MANHKGGRKGIPWPEVREYYFSSPDITYTDCSRKFGVSVRSVEDRASKENWVADRAATNSNVVEFRAKQLAKHDLRLHQKSKQLREPPPEVQTEEAVSPDDHVALADEMVAASRSVLREVRATAFKSIRAKVEALKATVETGEKALTMAREVRGMRRGDSSAKPSDKSITIETQRLEPKKIAVNGDGRAIT